MSTSAHWVQLVLVQARMITKSEAARFYLSYLWWILEPAFYVLIFYMVFSHLFDRGGPEFLIFLLIGKVPYLWFSRSVGRASESLLQNKALIYNVDLPKIIFPYISLVDGVYKEIFVLMVFFVALLLFGLHPSALWLWLIPLILVMTMFVSVCGLIGALLIAWQQDFRIMISMGLMALMFISGVFWDINSIQDEQVRWMFLHLNPLAFLIDAARKIVMQETMFDLGFLFLLFGLFSCLTGLLHLVYGRLSRKIAARVISL